MEEHLRGAIVRYNELCKLDDEETAKGSENSEYYVLAQQMFGYIAALEKCLKQAKSPNDLKPTPAPLKAAGKTRKTPKN